MSTTKVFFPAGIKVASTQFGNIADQSYESNLEDLTLFAAGHAMPNMTGGKSINPMFQVNTFDISKALDLMDDNVLCHDCSAEDVKLFLREAQSHGIRKAVDAAGAHIVLYLQNNAFLYWESIQGSQDDDALQIALRLASTANGVNDALQIPSEALPSPTTIFAPFTLGPIQVNGSQLTGVKNFQWQNNLEMIEEASDGEETVSFRGIQSIRPVIQFTTTNVAALTAFDQKGAAITTFAQYFRRRKPHGVNYADADTQHVKLSAAVGGTPPAGDAVGTIKWKQISESPATAKAEIHLQESQSGAAFLVYAKDVAIT